MTVQCAGVCVHR